MLSSRSFFLYTSQVLGQTVSVFKSEAIACHIGIAMLYASRSLIS